MEYDRSVSASSSLAKFEVEIICPVCLLSVPVCHTI